MMYKKGMLFGALFGFLIVLFATLGLVLRFAEVLGAPFIILPRAIVTPLFADPSVTLGGILIGTLVLASMAVYGMLGALLQWIKHRFGVWAMLGCVIVYYFLFAFFGISTVARTPTFMNNPEARMIPVRLDTSPLNVEGFSDVSSWNIFEDPDLGLHVSYPPEMKAQANEDRSLRLYYHGPTQGDGTEIYDGILMHFSLENISSDTHLASYAQSMYEKETGDLVEGIQNPVVTRVGDTEGYRYRVRGLGTFDVVLVPHREKNNTILRISMVYPDPQSVGYRAIVERVVSNLNFLTKQ